MFVPPVIGNSFDGIVNIIAKAPLKKRLMRKFTNKNLADWKNLPGNQWFSLTWEIAIL
jgi:hypothetical protein